MMRLLLPQKPRRILQPNRFSKVWTALYSVQVGEEHSPASCIEHLELKNISTVCARESNPPLLETRLLEMSAVDIDMFENVVVTMPTTDGNNNQTSTGPVSSNAQEAVSSKRKKLEGVRQVGRKKLSKGTGVVHAKEISKNHSLVSTLSRRTPGLTSSVGWQDCPECGKKIKQKSLYGHLYKMHNITSDLTICNVCRKLVSELNLMNHRKTLHPERFKSDRITCSGCNLVLRALDFDNHEC